MKVECQASRDFHLVEESGMVVGHGRVGDVAEVFSSCGFHTKGALLLF